MPALLWAQALRVGWLIATTTLWMASGGGDSQPGNYGFYLDVGLDQNREELLRLHKRNRSRRGSAYYQQ
jgi:hypothetical protein